MKKVILGLAGLLMLVSGVAMVSAYEAHLINVTAHVENAMSVNKDHVDFGTVFPEEWLTNNFTVGVSNSFCNEKQTRVTAIDYAVWVEWKPLPPGRVIESVVLDGAGNAYYPWLGDALYLGIEAVDLRPQAAGGDLTWVGATPPPGPQGAIKILASSLSLHKFAPYNFADLITIGLDVPVFEGYYNPLTDPEPKPSGLNDPTVVILKSDTARYFPNGVTLGTDIKVQVTNIYKKIVE